MKRIRVLAEPTRGLQEYHDSVDNPSWDEFCSHNAGASLRELRDTLARNQHELCAYCEIDIRQPPRQLEHVVPRSDAALGERKALDVANLVACCLGGTVRPAGPGHAGGDRYRAPVGTNMSCGQAKGNENDGAFIDPRALAESPSVMTVGRDGRIEADEAACQAARVVAEPVTRTIKILRLNAPRLRLARQKWRTALVEISSRHVGDADGMGAWIRAVLTPDGDGRLSPFFTTSRCYFGGAAERVLDEQPRTWI